MRHQPAHDVGKALGRVLHAADERHLGELAGAGLDASSGELLLIGMMHADMIAVHRVRTKGHMVDSHQVHAVLEMIHDAVDAMAGVGRVRPVVWGQPRCHHAPRCRPPRG